MFCLPPHTTHEAQPLDCTVLGLLKTHWSDVVHEYTQANPGKVVTKFVFSQLFSKAWMRALTPANCISGFRKCGVYPFNPEALKVPTTTRTAQSPSIPPPNPGISSTSVYRPPGTDMNDRRAVLEEVTNTMCTQSAAALGASNSHPLGSSFTQNPSVQ